MARHPPPLPTQARADGRNIDFSRGGKGDINDQTVVFRGRIALYAVRNIGVDDIKSTGVNVGYVVSGDHSHLPLRHKQKFGVDVPIFSKFLSIRLINVVTIDDRTLVFLQAMVFEVLCFRYYTINPVEKQAFFRFFK